MNRLTGYLAGLALALHLAFLVVPTPAQEFNRVKVTIPFDFVVGNKQLKAGDYVIESTVAKSALKLRGMSGDVQQVAFTVPVETNKTENHERLLFHRDGNQYFLSQVWFSGDEDGRELIPGSQEKTLAKSQPVSDQAIVGQ